MVVTRGQGGTVERRRDEERCTVIQLTGVRCSSALLHSRVTRLMIMEMLRRQMFSNLNTI
jgi:hypothetical protein